MAAQVRTALTPFLGSSLVAFDAREANRRIADVAAVAGASYDRAFPNTLRVVVRAERPMAVLRSGRDAWLVSGSARVLGQITLRPLPELPRVWLPPAVDPLAGAVLDGPTAIAVRTVVPLARADLLSKVRSIRAVDGEITLALSSGTQVLLGDTFKLRLKLAAAARILPDLAGAAYLDVSVPERAVAGMRPLSNPQVEG